MKKRKRRKSLHYNLQHPMPFIYLLPSLLIALVVPLIVRAKVVSIDGPLSDVFGTTKWFDFFSYYKAVFLLIFTAFFIIVFILAMKRRMIDFTWRLSDKLLGVYALFVLVSFLFSTHMGSSFLGIYLSYQGMLVMLAYGGIVFMMSHMVRDERAIKVFMGALVLLGVIVAAIGVGQYFGRDLFLTPFGQALILPDALSQLSESLNIRFGEYAIYATMANTNFVGSFAALMIPLAFTLYLYQKSFRYQFAAFVFFALMVFVGFGSNSRAGIIGIAFAILLTLALFRHFLIKKPFRTWTPFIAIALLAVALNHVSDGRIIDELRSLSITDDYERAQGGVFVEELSVDGDTVTLVTEKASIVITETEPGELSFTTPEGDTIDHTVDGARHIPEDETYEDFEVRETSDGVYRVFAYEHRFDVHMTMDGFRMKNNADEYVEPENPDRVEWLDEYEGMFSSRVYLWSRSWPVLFDKPLFGEGPDLFTLAFPQNDFAGRLNALGMGSVVDKPHNMYLQIGINTGIPSLLALLGVFGLYAVQSFTLYIKKSFHAFSEFVGAGLFLGVMAYLVTGFFNDQIVSVAPIFYSMLGLGFAVNILVRKQYGKDERD